MPLRTALTHTELCMVVSFISVQIFNISFVVVVVVVFLPFILYSLLNGSQELLRFEICVEVVFSATF